MPASTKEVKEMTNAMADKKTQTTKNTSILLVKSVGLTKTEVPVKVGSAFSKRVLGNRSMRWVLERISKIPEGR